MGSELDKIKSTITVSLGMKNRLRSMKGNLSYEKFIASLLRQRKATESNYIEYQQFKRGEGVYSVGDYKIIFSYNEYNNSANFFFDIALAGVRKKGKKASWTDLVQEQSGLPKDSPLGKSRALPNSYRIYFELLTHTIIKEIEPLFKHKGRYEDYYNWQEEFERLGLPTKAFENDVMEKLRALENGIPYD